jgi:hypothetical protein
MKIRFLVAARLALLVVVLVSVSLSAHAQKRRFRVGYKDAGFSFIPEATLLVPSNTYPLAFNMNAIFGGQFGQVFAGGGIGLDAYKSEVFVPIFADVRYYFLQEALSPYAMLEGGYSLAVDTSPGLDGGTMVTPGVGIRFFLTRTTAVNLGLVYRYQAMQLATEGVGGTVETGINVQSFGVRLGMQF